MMRSIVGMAVLVGCIVGFNAGRAVAQGKAAIAREVAEQWIKKLGPEAAGEGLEQFARRVEAVAARYGDEGLEAVRKIGPRSLTVIDAAGPQATDSVRLMARYGDEALSVVSRPSRMALVARHGDDAAEAMIRHGEIAEPLIGQYGAAAGSALRPISGQSARRLAMMNEAGELGAMGRTPELLAVVQRFGDAGMEFIWKNKAALATGVVLTAFLADPQPFIEGARDLASVAGTALVQPLAEGIGQHADWTRIILLVLVVSAIYLIFRRWLARRKCYDGCR